MVPGALRRRWYFYKSTKDSSVHEWSRTWILPYFPGTIPWPLPFSRSYLTFPIFNDRVLSLDVVSDDFYRPRFFFRWTLRGPLSCDADVLSPLSLFFSLLIMPHWKWDSVPSGHFRSRGCLTSHAWVNFARHSFPVDGKAGQMRGMEGRLIYGQLVLFFIPSLFMRLHGIFK